MPGSSFRLNWPAIKRQQIILLKSYQRDSRIGQQCRLTGGWRSPLIADFTWAKWADVLSRVSPRAMSTRIRFPEVNMFASYRLVSVLLSQIALMNSLRALRRSHTASSFLGGPSFWPSGVCGRGVAGCVTRWVTRYLRYQLAWKQFQSRRPLIRGADPAGIVRRWRR